MKCTSTPHSGIKGVRSAIGVPLGNGESIAYVHNLINQMYVLVQYTLKFYKHDIQGIEKLLACFLFYSFILKFLTHIE